MAKYYRSTFEFEGKRYAVRGKTKKEADKKAALKQANLEAGIIEETRMSVDSWWPQYLKTYHAHASEKTLSDYEGIYRNSIKPQIGRRGLKTIRATDLQKVLNKLSTHSDSYAKKAIFLLRGIFGKAVANGLIAHNPAEGLVAPPTPAPKERRALTPAERALFLQAASQAGKEGLFHLVIYYCGLRPSEVARIRREDADLISRTLKVRGTKTAAAERTVPIPAGLELPEWEGRLFSSIRGDEPSKTVRRDWWEKLVEKMVEISGKPIADDLTPYCLRHDYCTRLSEAQVPIEIASKLMGHSSITLTSKIYHHATPATLEIARNLIEKSDTKVTHSCHTTYSTLPESRKRKNPANVEFARVCYGASSGARTLDTLIKSAPIKVEISIVYRVRIKKPAQNEE